MKNHFGFIFFIFLAIAALWLAVRVTLLNDRDDCEQNLHGIYVYGGYSSSTCFVDGKLVKAY